MKQAQFQEIERIYLESDYEGYPNLFTVVSIVDQDLQSQTTFNKMKTVIKKDSEIMNKQSMIDLKSKIKLDPYLIKQEIKQECKQEYEYNQDQVYSNNIYNSNKQEQYTQKQYKFPQQSLRQIIKQQNSNKFNNQIIKKQPTITEVSESESLFTDTNQYSSSLHINLSKTNLDQNPINNDWLSEYFDIQFIKQFFNSQNDLQELKQSFMKFNINNKITNSLDSDTNLSINQQQDNNNKNTLKRRRKKGQSEDEDGVNSGQEMRKQKRQAKLDYFGQNYTYQDLEQIKCNLIKEKKKNQAGAFKTKEKTHFHNKNKLIFNSIIRFYNQQNLKQLQLSQLLIDTIEKITNQCRSGGMKFSKNQKVIKTDGFNHSHYRAMFMILKDYNFQDMKKYDQDIQLHKLMFEIDIKEYQTFRDVPVEKIWQINFLKSCIYQIFINYIKIPLLSRAINIEDFEYEERACKGIKFLNQGRFISRF